MSTSIALLSGKGGSGKTSLALTMASLLSECNIKTLMIDCDMATNGATYFFESKLNESDGVLDSIDSILQECISPSNAKGISSLYVKDCFSFFPSITKAREEHISYGTLTTEESAVFQNVMSMITDKFDVLIYDFQAGYSELMKLLLPMIDIVLFVIEPDAVSASSLRSLYLKISDVSESKKTYQVFNKASKEEYEIYSKLYSGTLFPTIDTIRFDWEIRKAFSLAQLPSIDNCGYQYLKQVIALSTRLIDNDELQSKLTVYSDEIELNQIEKRSKELDLRLRQCEARRINIKGTVNPRFALYLKHTVSILSDVPLVAMILTIATVILLGTLLSNETLDIQEMFILTVLMCFAAIMEVIIKFLKKTVDTDENVNNELERSLLKHELESLDSDRQKLLKKMGKNAAV